MAELTPDLPAFKVGYYDETCGFTVHGETGLSVWVPLASNHDGPRVGSYKFDYSERKLLRNLPGIDIPCLDCGATFSIELPSVAYSATSKDAASPRGLGGLICVSPLPAGSPRGRRQQRW